MRLSYFDCSLADLYDPLTAPKDLMKEHVALDKAVDSAYGFKGEDDQRIQFLFELYEKTIKK